MIVNLTPHPITVRVGKWDHTYPPSGKVARVNVEQVPADPIDGIPVKIQHFTNVVNLPDPQPDVYYIVSLAVAQVLKDRDDLLVPDTSNAIRDENGRIIAVPGFIKLGCG